MILCWTCCNLVAQAKYLYCIFDVDCWIRGGGTLYQFQAAINSAMAIRCSDDYDKKRRAPQGYILKILLSALTSCGWYDDKEVGWLGGKSRICFSTWVKKMEVWNWSNQRCVFEINSFLVVLEDFRPWTKRAFTRHSVLVQIIFVFYFVCL